MVNKKVRDQYVASIGIETHVQLKTKTKLFSAVDNDARDKEPNTTVSPICFGLPGTLPYLNEEAINLSIKAGLALNGDIAEFSKFDRKHYFYPDLPKGYQITQFDQPIITQGYVNVPLGKATSKKQSAKSTETFKVRITRAHLEEDAGKNTHPAGADYTLVDLNRAGTPLLEIVSEPDMHSPEEAKAYVKELYLLIKYAGVSDVDLYHGNMRFDVNVSVAKKGAKQLGTRSETKNLNSFRSVERTVAYEIDRQIEELEKGRPIVQETRGWDEAKQKTLSQRGKEEAHDYRYFPEPDLPPIRIGKDEVSRVKKVMPRLPGEWRQEMSEIGVSDAIVEVLLEHPQFLRGIYNLKEATNKEYANDFSKFLVNVWLGQEETAKRNFTSGTQELKGIFELKKQDKLSSTSFKELMIKLQGRSIEGTVEEFAKEKGLIQVSDTAELEKIVDKVIAGNPRPVQDVKNGETKAIGFLVGQVMKESKGKANPQIVNKLLKEKLSNENSN